MPRVRVGVRLLLPTVAIDYPPVVLAFSVVGPITHIALKELKAVAERLRKTPSALIVINIHSAAIESARSVEKKRSPILTWIASNLPPHTPVRIVEELNVTNDDRTMIYLVPPGATPPF